MRHRRLSPTEFDRVVDAALEELPDWVVDAVDNLHVVVAARPSREQDPDGSGLLGIYEGISLLERSGDYWGAAPDRIVIFRESHLDLDLSPRDLREEIRRTVLHEMAHHLGIDDDRLHELGWD